jgi:hypothetical protein
LSATGGVQGFNFETGLQCFKYVFLAAAHKTLKSDSTMKNLDRLARNGGNNFPKVNFDCLEGKHPVSLKEITIFEKANENVGLGVVVLQYDTEFVNGGKKPNKKGVLYSVRTPLVDNVKNWVWIIYEPPKDVNSYGNFSPLRQ